MLTALLVLTALLAVGYSLMSALNLADAGRPAASSPAPLPLEVFQSVERGELQEGHWTLQYAQGSGHTGTGTAELIWQHAAPPQPAASSRTLSRRSPGSGLCSHSGSRLALRVLKREV